MDYINYYVAKVSDDEFYINLLTNYKGDLWDVEHKYEYKDDFDFDSIEVQKSKMNYIF